jgi:DNA invertase Pin-like site-specific DNA recombinase
MIGELDPGTVIVVERLDRLARDLGVQEFCLRDLKKRGVTLHSTAEPDLSSSDPTRILFRQIIGAVAAYDRAMIAAKLRHARERKRKKNGRCEGRKPFGYRPEETPILAIITHDSIHLRWSTREIATHLNALGHATRSGGRWHHGTVAKILEAYRCSQQS